MGYHAMALGPEELELGLETLDERMGEADFPMLSANVVLSATGELLAQPYTVLELGDRRLGVLGLTRVPAETLTEFRVLDPGQAMTRYVPELAREVDTVVVLTNQTYRSALALAQEVSGIDLIIAALPGQLPENAVRVPGTGTLVVTAEQASPRHSGRRVGKLGVTLDRDGSLSEEQWESVWMDPSIADDPEMAELVEGYRP